MTVEFSLPITAVFAGVMALFSLALSARAGGYRGKVGVSILYGEPIDWELAERVRVHQNFLEYVPMVLILMGVIEASGGNGIFLHVIGIGLIIARIAHAIGLKHDDMSTAGRFIGAAGTALITLVAAVYAIWLAVSHVL